MNNIGKLILLALLAPFTLTACDSANEPATTVSEQVEQSQEANSMDDNLINEGTEEIDQAIEQTQEAAEDAAQPAEDTLKDASEAMQSKTEEMSQSE